MVKESSNEWWEWGAREAQEDFRKKEDQSPAINLLK
jgi:hypothetical protein